jgi:uncharacterized membrane protein
MVTLRRVMRHLFSSRLHTRALFTRTVRAQVQSACAAAEAQHAGEIRFVVETALPLAAVCRGLTPRRRALQLFAQLHLWDTHHNNGVLIYVLRADRAVEIVADRGISAHVTPAEWEGICRDVEAHYRQARYLEGSLAAVNGVARLLARHFPAGMGVSGGGPAERGQAGKSEDARTSGHGSASAAATESDSGLPNQPVLL